jgi:hypothetical protein
MTAGTYSHWRRGWLDRKGAPVEGQEYCYRSVT